MTIQKIPDDAYVTYFTRKDKLYKCAWWDDANGLTYIVGLEEPRFCFEGENYFQVSLKVHEALSFYEETEYSRQYHGA